MYMNAPVFCSLLHHHLFPTICLIHYQKSSLGFKIHSPEDPDISLIWRLKNPNQIMNVLLSHLSTNKPYSRVFYIRTRPQQLDCWQILWMDLGPNKPDYFWLTTEPIRYIQRSDISGWKDHIYSPATMKNWLRYQKLHLRPTQSLLYSEKSQLQSEETPNNKYTRDSP